MGFGFLLVGLIGFAKPDLLGMHLSVWHNVVHLLTAALSLYFGFAASLSAARTFAIAFGAVYALLGILGFIAPGLVSEILQAHHAPNGTSSLAGDNLVHILLGAIFLIGGLVPATGTTHLGQPHAGQH